MDFFLTGVDFRRGTSPKVSGPDFGAHAERGANVKSFFCAPLRSAGEREKKIVPYAESGAGSGNGADAKDTVNARRFAQARWNTS